MVVLWPHYWHVEKRLKVKTLIVLISYMSVIEAHLITNIEVALAGKDKNKQDKLEVTLGGINVVCPDIN